MFSKACEYGIRAMVYIAHQSEKGKRVRLKEIAKAIDSPEAFTAKILQSLTKDDLISSKIGTSGGYEIQKVRSSKITLREIVKSIDGDKIYKGCGLGLKECNESKPCPVHHQFKAIRDDLSKMLQNTTIEELALELKSGMAYLKR